MLKSQEAHFIRLEHHKPWLNYKNRIKLYREKLCWSVWTEAELTPTATDHLYRDNFLNCLKYFILNLKPKQ